MPVSFNVDGERINACLSLALQHYGHRCGYRTPGRVCSAVSVLNEIEAGVPRHRG